MSPRTASLALLLLLPAGAARAQEPAPEPRHAASVTISPVHFILPVVEVTGELRATDKIGVAVIGGAGSVKVEGADDRVGVWEVGGSVRGYLLGDFDGGMQLGAELIYMHADAESGGVTASADGVSVGAFVGYKWIHASGFTFDGQLGFQAIGIGSQASNGNSDEETGYGPLLNLDLGWSF